MDLGQLSKSLQAETAALEALLKQRTKGLAKCDEAVKNARKSKKLRSVGSIKQVVLYDDEVRMDGFTIPLGPDVRASAATTGVKETRGIFRADEDRRELMLQVDWPGGSRVVYWERNSNSIMGSLVEPKDVHAMAAAINTAAANAGAIGARRHAGLGTARENRRQYLRASVELVEKAVATHALSIRATSEAANSLRTPVGGVVAKDRSRDALLKSAGRALAAAATVSTNAAQTADRWKKYASPLGDGEWEAPPAAPEGDAQSHNGGRHALTAAPSEPASEESGPQLDPAAGVKLLKELRELLDAGILTQEEFDSKKSAVLRRM